MSLLEFGPRSWFSSRNYNIVQNGTLIGEINCAWARERGSIRIGDALVSGAFFLEASGRRLVSAEKPNALHRLFTLHLAGKTFTLKAASAFWRAFVLIEGDREVGTIAPLGLFTRKAMADLPDDLSLEVKAFLIWLVVVMWNRNRQANAAASSSASATGAV